MGIFDFFTGKSKAAPAPAGATDAAAAPAEALAKELEKLGFDVSTVDIEVAGDKVTLNGAVNSREELEKIVLAVGKVLTECCDETYSLVGENSALLENFNRLGIGYGYEDDNGIV